MFLKYAELFSNLGVEALLQVEAQGFFPPYAEMVAALCASEVHSRE